MSYEFFSDVKVDGSITANNFSGDGTNVDISNLSNPLSTTGNISGAILFGDASGLSGIATSSLNSYVNSYIGNGVDSTFTINHQLDSNDLIVTCRDNNNNELSQVSYSTIDSSSIDVTFSVVPSVSQYTIGIIKLSDYKVISRGFSVGGGDGSILNTIDFFEYSSNITATDHGDLINARSRVGTASSTTQGFHAGGSNSGSQSTMSKFDFVSNVTSVSHGNLSNVMGSLGEGTESSTHGFVAGGQGASSPTNRIESFEFVSNVTANDLANLQRSKTSGTVTGSNTQGFHSGGNNTTTNYNEIDKFDYVSTVNAVDHGDLTIAKTLSSGVSSSTTSFIAGGYTPTVISSIDKFEFTSNVLATSHGDLSGNRETMGGHNDGDTRGFFSGGMSVHGVTYLNTIEYITYATITSAVDHGDLSVIRGNVGGCQG